VAPESIEALLKDKPFVDPIIHRATLNRPLADELNLQYDFTAQSMLVPGTSDAQGAIALDQTWLKLDHLRQPGDICFFSDQYFVKGDLTPQQLTDFAGLMSNPNLHRIVTSTKAQYEAGVEIKVPIVTLSPEVKVETFDLLSMSDQELLALNSKRRLAMTLEEMHIFRDQYKDPAFLEKRRSIGLTELATDVDLETNAGLRSEHCFHKEFNAKITIADTVNDPHLARAFERGWLTKNDVGEYVLERGLFKTFIRDPAEEIYAKLEARGNNWIVSMFEDNSGVVLYDQDFAFCSKFETHNSPSNKEPVEGAKTGIDGVNRDIYGTMDGTFDPISNFFWYNVGRLNYEGWLPKGVKHPYVLFKRVTRGVREGGNESQIPTLGGGMTTDPRFVAKIEVHCGTIGWSPVRDKNGRSYMQTDASVDDLVFVAGHKVGVDGIHGATESSLKASENISLGHVQKDDSYTQVKMRYFILEAARLGLFTDITDCGAMGIGSATHELARKTGGLFLDLAKHPVKYQGIWPWQINCSETQDRMVFSCRKENVPLLEELARKHEVDITQLGKLKNDGYIQLMHGDKAVGLFDIEKLFDPNPRKHMHATWNGPGEQYQKDLVFKNQYTFAETLCMVLGEYDCASPEWLFRQKDSRVGGGTIIGPLLGLDQEVAADATMQKPLDTRGRDNGAIAYAMGIAPKLSDISPYHAAQKSFIDAIGKIVALGVALPDMKNPKYDAWLGCGNYCQPDSDSTSTLTKESGEHNLASLVLEGIGVREVEEKTNVGIFTGKDSMKCSCTYEVDDSFDLENVPLDLRQHITLVKDEATGKRHIEIHDPDSYLVSLAVKVQDYRKCVTADFKEDGDVIYVVGTTKNHLGASQLASAVGYKENGTPLQGGNAPEANIDEFVAVAAAIPAAVDSEYVASCKYICEGGLSAAVAKSAMAGKTGATIDVEAIVQDGSCTKDNELLYSETPGRFIVSVAPHNVENFERTMGQVPFSRIGYVTSNDEIKAKRLDDTLESVALRQAKSSYQQPLRFDLDDARPKAA